MEDRRDLSEIAAERVQRIEEAVDAMSGVDQAKAIIESADVLIREAAGRHGPEINDWLNMILWERPRERGAGPQGSFSLRDVIQGVRYELTPMTRHTFWIIIMLGLVAFIGVANLVAGLS